MRRTFRKLRRCSLGLTTQKAGLRKRIVGFLFYASDELQGGDASRIRSVEQGLALVVSKPSGFRHISDLRGTWCRRRADDKCSKCSW